MPELVVWKREEMNRLRRDMGRMFARVWDDFGMPHVLPSVVGPTWIEVTEKADRLSVRLEIPEMDPDNLEVHAAEDLLTIRGFESDETVRKGKGRSQRERRSISFSRSLRMPCRIIPEEASATFSQGVLKIDLPKCKPPSARKLDIRVE
ncbi:MAG: Hsp20/alpha crystallin family protein [Desulfobacteraceae bacterium]|jgi:HSP20 family protein